MTTAVFTLNELRIGDVTAYGLRVVDIQVAGPFGSPDAEHTVHFHDGSTVTGRGDTTLTLSTKRD